jgi:WD40 repeat protein
MGCGGSSGASDPSAEKINWNKDADINDEFKNEHLKAGGKKKAFDKKTGKAIEKEKVTADREFDFFEGADAGSGEQFMAVRPYEGAIVEPAQHNDPSNSAPDVTYNLEYVYGYRAEDSRMNCFFNKNGNACYFTAALGVILDQDKNTQKFFGGGQTDNKSKQVARDDMYHTNDITAMDMSTCRGVCATGQNGSVPVAFTWDATTGEKKGRYKLDKGSREVTAIAISQDGKYVAMCDNHNDHNIFVFDLAKGTQVKKDKTGPDRIYHMAWSLKKDDSIIATAGEKHFAVWDLNADSFKKKKGIYGDKGKPTSHSCVCWDDAGNAYSGGANSCIYVWAGQNLTKTYDVHGTGFVGAIRWCDGKIVSGAKDGKVVISNPEDGTAEKTIDVGELVRSVDMKGSKILAGLRNGTILEIDSKGSKKEIMKSHSDGEAWGLAVADKDTFVTSGDDNKIYVWDAKTRKPTALAEICDEEKKSKAGGASSLTEYAPSKCARAVAINVAGNGNVAIGHNDGRVTVRSGVKGIDKIIKTLTDSAEWIECMAYSPDGTMLAVGSHDNNIYIYSQDDYSKIGTLKGHNSFIVSVDWSEDSKYIRSVCGAHELLFFTTENCKQDPSGASNTTETVWHTSSAKYGWLVTGIFPSGTDGTHINHVDFSTSGNLIVTADDYGLVNVWRNPARLGATPISLRGHSEHVVRTYFSRGEDLILSIGGYDKAIMQWKKC